MMRAFVLALPLLLGSCASPATEPPPPPNLVFVLVDDLGYGDLSCYRQTPGSSSRRPNARGGEGPAVTP